VTPNQSEERTKEYLDELAFLAETSEIVPEKRFIQAVQTPHSQTYVGQGKLEEIKQYIDDNGIEIAIFDDELSPRQLRNIEKKLCIQVLDRTSLILDIFAQRAQTSYAKTQVEMAQLQYMLPRLTRMWSHLDRQRGGGTTSRGMGETQIEADKRIIQSRISLLREDLKRIDKQMETQRRNRGKMVRVALVGYTNVGKSTLMNLLCKTMCSPK
jgi:GTP-binding protein HflX